jgi:hypothetical protein
LHFVKLQERVHATAASTQTPLPQPQGLALFDSPYTRVSSSLQTHGMNHPATDQNLMISKVIGWGQVHDAVSAIT